MAIACDTIKKRSIQNHYDLSTLFYRLLWGPHIHHGYWNADESPRLAQLQLTERLAEMAGIQNGEKIVDIGCGMGGSSVHLAKTRQCSVTGVTLSPVQRRWAQASARMKGVQQLARFRRHDAETVEFDDASIDVVWSIECTEHLFDKPAFFAKCARWLRPGGRIAICAWLCGDREEDPETKRLVSEVCEGFLCPSLGTQHDHRAWMTQSGLEMQEVELCTEKVLKTWEICRDRVRRTGVRWLAKVLGQEHVLFLDRFDAILEAYRTRAMEYGLFVAKRVDQ